MHRIYTHYDTLKVARDAPIEVIKSAYRALARKYHPDSNPDLEEAVKAMQALNHAFEVLIDPIQRKAHDEWIDQQVGAQAKESGHQRHQGSGVDENKKAQSHKSQHAGQFGLKSNKLTPGIVVAVVALAAALITVVIIALEAHGRSSKTTAQASESAPLPVPAFTPTPTATPTPIPAPSPTPEPTPTPTSVSSSTGSPPLTLAFTPAAASAEVLKTGPWTNLRLIDSKIEKLRVKFMGLPSDSLDEISINTISSENPKQPSGSTRFYRRGDMVVLSEIIAGGREQDRPTPLKFERAEMRKRFNATTNVEEEIPVVFLRNTTDGVEIELQRGEVKDSPYPVATFTDARDGGKEFTLRVGQQFELESGQRYKLLEVSDDGATIEDISSGERFLIRGPEQPHAGVPPVRTVTLAPARRPTPAPTITPAPPSTPAPALRSGPAAYSEAISIDFAVGGDQQLRKQELAGLFPSANWSTASGASGRMSNLITSTGKATKVIVDWRADGIMQGLDVRRGEDANFPMMLGYVDAHKDTSTSTVLVDNIPDNFIADGYDLIVYTDGSNASSDRVGRYTVFVPGGESVTKFIKDGAGHNFDGKFVEAGTATDSDVTQGNTIVFRNISSREFELWAKSHTGLFNNHAPINGIQIAKRKGVAGSPGSARTESNDPEAASNSLCLTELSPTDTLLHGDLMINRYNGPSASRILVDGMPCDRYIFAHAPSRLIYKIPPGYRYLTAVGIKPSGDRNIKGDWIYIVRAGGKEVFRSGKLADDPSGQIKVSASLPPRRADLRADR